MQEILEKFTINKPSGKINILLCLIIFFLIYYKFIFFGYTIVPFGYDPWLYREIHFVWQNLFQSWFDRSLRPKRLEHEPLWWFFSVLFAKVGIGIDTQLSIWWSTISIIPWLIIVSYISRKSSLTWWLFWWLLYYISVIQREATTMMYYKQLIALSLWLFLLIIAESQYKLWAGLVIFMMLWFHRHTTLFFVLILWIDKIIDFFFNKTINKKLLLSILIGIFWGLLFYIPLFHKLIVSYAGKFVSTGGGSGHQWVFFSLQEFLQFDLVLIIWWIGYCVFSLWKKNKDLSVIAIIIGIVWIVFWLLNANRQQILLDPFLIIWTVLFLSKLSIYWGKKAIILIISSIIIVQWSFRVGYSSSTMPLIPPSIFEDIKSIAQITNIEDTIFIDNSAYTTWIMWYSMRKWISPGLSDDNKRNLIERENRWSADREKKCKLITKYIADSKQLRYRTPFFIQEQSDCFSNIQKLSNSYLYRITVW